MRKIEEIVDITFGLYAKSSPTGTIPYLQISDFDKFGKLQIHSTSFVDNKDIEEKRIDIGKYFLQRGDILMPARGIKNTAYLIKEEMQAVASTLFFVIRIANQVPILPEFLCVYLNHPNTQNKIKSMVSSSVTVPTINKKDFLELSVPMVSLREQQKVISVYQLHQEEKAMLIQLVEKKEQLINAIITKILEENE